jgi:DNA-binding NtrC family response regulator
VLLVDDDPLVRGLLRQILARAGYRVLEAATGEEAQVCAERHQGPIHLLLTDVVMPGMNGRRLAELVRASRQETRVLVMSGYTDDAELRQAVRVGQLPFIEKPFRPDGLLSKLREVLAMDVAAAIPAGRAG